MPPRKPRSDKGEPRGPRGGYKKVPKGLTAFADIRYLNKYQLAEAAGYTDHAFKTAQVKGTNIPKPEPEFRDALGRAMWDTHRKDVQRFVETQVEAWKTRNAKRLKGD